MKKIKIECGMCHKWFKVKNPVINLCNKCCRKQLVALKILQDYKDLNKIPRNTFNV